MILSINKTTMGYKMGILGATLALGSCGASVTECATEGEGHIAYGYGPDIQGRTNENRAIVLGVLGTALGAAIFVASQKPSKNELPKKDSEIPPKEPLSRSEIENNLIIDKIKNEGLGQYMVGPNKDICRLPLTKLTKEIALILANASLRGIDLYNLYPTFELDQECTTLLANSGVEELSLGYFQLVPAVSAILGQFPGKKLGLSYQSVRSSWNTKRVAEAAIQKKNMDNIGQFKGVLTFSDIERIMPDEAKSLAAFEASTLTLKDIAYRSTDPASTEELSAFKGNLHLHGKCLPTCDDYLKMEDPSRKRSAFTRLYKKFNGPSLTLDFGCQCCDRGRIPEAEGIKEVICPKLVIANWTIDNRQWDVARELANYNGDIEFPADWTPRLIDRINAIIAAEKAQKDQPQS